MSSSKKSRARGQGTVRVCLGLSLASDDRRLKLVRTMGFTPAMAAIDAKLSCGPEVWVGQQGAAAG